MEKLWAKIEEFYWKYRHSIFRYILLPVIIGAGPAAISISKHFEYSKRLFEVHWIWAAILECYPAFLLIAARWMVSKISSSVHIEETQLMGLLRIIDQIVGSKSDRFARKAAETARNTGQLGEEIFLTITQPDMQMQELTNGIFHFFDRIKPNPHAKMKVILARMGAKHIDSFACCAPADERPRGDITSYQNKQCGFSIAKREAKILIIDSIHAELKKPVAQRRYSFTPGAADDEAGSIFVYPVTLRNSTDTPYCISVWCSTPYAFTKSKKNFLIYIMEMFEKRILLEYSLLVIRSSVEARK